MFRVIKLSYPCWYFLFQMDDEDSVLPHKLQAALEHVLERRKELACDVADNPSGELLAHPYGSLFIINSSIKTFTETSSHKSDFSLAVLFIYHYSGQSLRDVNFFLVNQTLYLTIHKFFSPL